MKINDYSSKISVFGTNRTMSAAVSRNPRKGASADSSAQSVTTSISPSAKLVARAVENLRKENEIREDAVAAARAQLLNWQGLSPDQVDRIAQDMLSDPA
jgi:acyl-CoA reductase-like NAD-dependent aldehyde dehydrogenase